MVQAADSPSTPSAPTKVTASETSIQIAWLAPSASGHSALVGYKVYWNGGGNGALISTPIYDSGSASILTYTVTPVTTGVSYLFSVSAYNSVAESPRSATVTIIAATVPA